jgi:hypothetical protein
MVATAYLGPSIVRLFDRMRAFDLAELYGDINKSLHQMHKHSKDARSYEHVVTK